MSRVKKYIVNLLVAFDEFFNALALGSPHETISARLGRNYPDTWIANIVDTLFAWQRLEHCETAAVNEPADYEKDALAR
jgi:hypothetical protein